ncbi:MAG: histidine kinase dimerization/phosphoacceptor domain -containing protein [Deltaproteobacteria bacterium]
MPDATDNRVLSQLMLLQGTLDSMPTDESISRFVSRGLKSVPGVSFLNVCVRGTVAEKNDLCASCNYRWGETEDKFDYLCKPKDDSNTKHLPIRTADRLYGFVIFSLNDTPDAFTPYEPYLQNIVNVIAISIDNRRQKQVLEAFNKQLQGEVEHRKQVEEALRHENIFIEALFESIPGMLYVYDDQGTHIRHNKKHEEMTGYSEEELSHLNPLSWYDDKADIVRVEAVINDVFTRGFGEVDAPMRIKNGEKLFMHFTGSRMIMDGKKYFIGVGIDITTRKQAEETIKASLLEKETLLKEIHHRVKNNLQVISSLLDLQSSYLQDEKAKEMLKNSMDRISTMAKIHTMLYQSEDMARVDFGGFIRDLAGRLQQSCMIAAAPIQVHADIADISLTIETSIPCGLILNELVSNALKHAFPEKMFKVQGSRFKAGETGEITITMTEESTPPSIIEQSDSTLHTQDSEPRTLNIEHRTPAKQVILTVSDNGIGFPEGVDFRNTKSLGLELVNLLVGQINGTITLTVKGGTTFTITFPAAKGG